MTSLNAVLILVVALTAACDQSSSEQAKAAAEAAKAAEAKAREDAAAAREAQRLAALWTYHDVPVDRGRQLTASINSTDDVDTGGASARRVQLVFRDHPSWGRSSYLVLQDGDFACSPRCKVAVSVDDGPSTAMAAHRPKTDEAIAMFIDDAPGLWRLTTGAKRVTIEFPVAGRGMRTAQFDVGGLDRSRLPGWDR